MARMVSSLKHGAAILGVAALAACAGGAPPLPDAQTSTASSAQYAELDCTALAATYEKNNRELTRLRQENKKQSKENQIVGYFFLPALLATDDTDVVREKINALTTENDGLLREYQTRQCK